MHKLFEQNTQLVYKVLRNLYIHQNHSHYEDLVQSGMIGLHKACQTYDAAKGQFSTWAYLFIRKEVQKEIAASSDALISYTTYQIFCDQNESTISLDKPDKDGMLSMYNLLTVSPDDDKLPVIRDFFDELGIDIDILEWVYLSRKHSDDQNKAMLKKLQELDCATRIVRPNACKQAMRAVINRKVEQLTKKPKYKNMCGEGDFIKYSVKYNKKGYGRVSKRYICNLTK